ncbi:MAG: bifunctional enzyme IspD/IspF [Alphaproteobacteria bacterium]|nr:MAG: bifunctional enzyme IspD/IspF [Alphaproteobacteria bacterium]
MAGVAAIIVAAGRGERLADGGGPKQYRDLGGRTVLARAIAPFLAHGQVEHVIAVIHAHDRSRYEAAVAPHPKLLEPATGGATRQQSVANGLAALVERAPERVLIHDAARPFVTPDLITTVLAAVGPGRGAVPGAAVADTLKRCDGDGLVHETVPRAGLFAVQTPQGFRFADILAAHEQAKRRGVGGLTDDAAVAEAAGLAVRIVPSHGDNMKITTAQDLELARQRVGAVPQPADYRTGSGYDVHRLAEGDHVMLCGLRIAHDRGLDGHSDADVGLHALTDAVLGTIGAGDIGGHFPPSDPRWRGAASDRFLAHACALVRAAGGAINHLDVTLVCEAPKIGPHRQAMRDRIAAIVGIDASRVSVKATTNEGLGFVGRGEGIAALATATAMFAAGRAQGPGDAA